MVDEAYAEFRRRRHAERADVAGAIPAAGRHSDDEQGVRIRRRTAGLPGSGTGGGRRAADRSAALPPVRGDPGGGPRGPRTRRRAARPGRGTAHRTRRDGGLAGDDGLRAADSDANFVLFGTFADWHAVWQGLLDRGVLIRETGPDGWLRVSIGTPEEMAAFRTALEEVIASMSPDAGTRSNGTTNETKVARRDRPRRHGPHRRRRPGSASTTTCSPPSASTDCSTSPSRSRATCTSTRTTPSRTPRSRSARPSRRPSATSPAPDASATHSSRMDEALVQAAVDLSGRPYLVHREPDGAPPTIGPDYATTLTRHVFESFTHHAAVGLHLVVLSGRDWHHITEAQYKAVARALRLAVELDPRVPACRPPRACCSSVASGSSCSTTGRAIFARHSAPSTGSAQRSRSPPTRARRWPPTGWWCRASARSRACMAGTGGRRRSGRGRRAGGSAAAGVGHLRRACRCCSTPASSTACETEGCMRSPAGSSRFGRRSCRIWGGTRCTPNPGRGCSPACRRTPGTTSCTPTPRGVLRSSAHDRRCTANRSLRRMRASAVGHPVPPGEVRRRRGGTAAQLAGDPVETDEA